MTAADLDMRETLASAQPIAENRTLRGIHRSRLVRIMVYVALILADIIVIGLTPFTLATLLSDGLRPEDAILTVLTMPVFVIVTFYTRSYTFPAMHSLQAAGMRVVHAWLVTLAIVLLIVFSSKQSEAFSRSIFLLSACVALPIMIWIRIAAVRFVRSRLSRQFVCGLFIEDDVIAEVPALFDGVRADSFGLKPDAYDPISLHNFSCLSAAYDNVIVACPADRRQQWALYLQAVGCNGELLIPELAGLAVSKGLARHNVPTVQVSVGKLDLFNRMLKRMLDLAITVPLVVILSPVMLAVAVAIRMDSRGPVLFRQQRMGRSNRLFDVMKFRSMRHEKADRAGDRSASRGDDRITRVGRLIRATSIDELPQLFNVLRGDMALVGPRPHALGSRAGEDLFWHVDHRYWLRHSIKPGITGLAQVRGYRGATDHREDLSNRLRSDLEYVAEWSIFRDLLILIRTTGVVIHNKAY
ncbi:sugar transferase [uncultured Sphingomonas sp.]|uniref:sugar transferase n=1 Tax=uncultured Sphingomonas sp. TaxID=158754 RepID=UPI0035CB300C